MPECPAAGRERPVPRPRARRAVLPLVALLAACGEAPNSFRPVGLERAQAFVRESGARVVEVVESEKPAPASEDGHIPWQLPADDVPTPPDLPDGPVLVIGASEGVGRRAAAALARVRNQPVLLIISKSAEERRTLYALAAPPSTGDTPPSSEGAPAPDGG